jgi:hypothetical protein
MAPVPVCHADRTTYGVDLVAARADVLGELGGDKHPLAAPQRASGLEDELGAQQVRQEREALAVLHHDVVVGDHAEHVAGVRAHRGVEPRHRSAIFAVKALLGDRPGEAGGRAKASSRVCGVSSRTTPRPCHAGVRTSMSVSCVVMP